MFEKCIVGVDDGDNDRCTPRCFLKHSGFPVLKVCHVPNKHCRTLCDLVDSATVPASCRDVRVHAAGAAPGLVGDAFRAFSLRGLCICCTLFFPELSEPYGKVLLTQSLNLK